MRLRERLRERAVPPAPVAGPVLSVAGLDAGYHGVPVVHDVTMVVHPGEVVAMLGSNGAGKTTTLSAVAGLIAPFAGTVSLCGNDISGQTAHRVARRGLALVPENRALFHDLTARQNLQVARGRDDSTEDEVVDLLPELAKCLDRKAGVLSGGEQQMLAIGRALVTRPRVLIIDEMSLGLAPVVLERLAPVLRRVATSFDTGVLVVEQHVSVALEEAERAYVLARGRIVVSATTETLRARRDTLMACYLGDLDAAAQLGGVAPPPDRDARATS